MARKVPAGRCSTATWRRPVGAIGRPMVIALPGVARGGGRLPYCAREIGKAPCQLADGARSGHTTTVLIEVVRNGSDQEIRDAIE